MNTIKISSASVQKRSLSFVQTTAALALLIAGISGPVHAFTPRDGQTVSLQASKGKFVGVSPVSRTMLAAYSPEAGPGEQFRLSVDSSGRVTLQQGQGYVSIDAAGFLRTGADRQSAASLRIISLEGGAIALETRQGKFVRAGVGEGSYLAAASEHIRSWEQFTVRVIPVRPEPPRQVERTVTLRAENGRYLRAGVGEEGTLAAVSEEARLWETFTLKPEGGRNSFQIVDGKGRVLKATPDGEVQAVDRRRILRRGGDQFEIVELGRGVVAIKTAFGKYLTVQPRGSVKGTSERPGHDAQFSLREVRR